MNFFSNISQKKRNKIKSNNNSNRKVMANYKSKKKEKNSM